MNVLLRLDKEVYSRFKAADKEMPILFYFTRWNELAIDGKIKFLNESGGDKFAKNPLGFKRAFYKMDLKTDKQTSDYKKTLALCREKNMSYLVFINTMMVGYLNGCIYKVKVNV